MSIQPHEQKDPAQTIAYFRDNFSVQARKQDMDTYQKVGVLIANVKSIKEQSRDLESTPAVAAALKACFHDMLRQPKEIAVPVMKIIRRSAKQLRCEI